MAALQHPTRPAGTGPTVPLTRPSHRRQWMRWLVLATLAGFAGWAIASSWTDVIAALEGLAPSAAVAAVVPAVAAMLVALLVWRSMLADLGHALPVPAAARVFFISQLGKYVPGSVWSILTQMELSRD